jgi:hypothetical protein
MNALTLMLLATIPSQGDAPRPDMVLKWNEVALQAIRSEKTPPPVAARNLAIMHLAMFDSLMAIERTHVPYLVDTTAPPTTSREAAVAATAHRSLVGLFPCEQKTLDLIFARCLLDIPPGPERDNGAVLGNHVAERMLEARCNDGSAATGKYTYKSFVGAWRPTAPLFKDALLPEWGYVKPFAIKKGAMHRPDGPPPLDSLQFAAAFNQVQRLGGKDSVWRTREQTEIAHFWADDAGTVTPPGHWNRIAQSIAQERRTTLVENARLFAHLNMSLADAGILCWVIKFTFDFFRPITSIRETTDERWTPLLNTPPFPAYISGHSTFSSAAAASLGESFGTDKIRFATGCDELPGVTRKFDSLWSAAEEAGMSRIYGGIHWKFDNEDGLQVGKTLGEYVTKNTLLPRVNALRPALPKITTEQQPDLRDLPKIIFDQRKD